MKKILFLALFLLPLVQSNYAFIEKKLFVGSIQFPKLKSIPNVRIYYRGNKIKSETDQEGKKVTFSLSENKLSTFFYLLITEQIHSETENNTIKYFKIQTNQKYKLFSLELITDNKGKSEWRIKEQQIPFKTGRIPDDAIIICYNPAFVEKIVGGTEIELPKIYIKDNIVSLVGSEDKLHDKSIELLLSSLDYDALHSTIKQAVKQDISLKTVVALDL